MISLTYTQAALLVLIVFVSLCAAIYYHLTHKECVKQLNHCLRFIRRLPPENTAGIRQTTEHQPTPES